ncbi:MAG: preprotein translocase subunit SecG [Burkholderiales bacterium]|jgi:preprotein translocase subunit SecG|nr:preprotein translocase subunit SecG [Burkholderiales bacterium]MCA3154239.1 preprotein translocase subunit SecG [Burkholderiales bacterium]MCA3159864.1 preprotein translocase subunit SecG [Burkholderiales bacterium]MCA3162744.1 preprotein translocase subunit SecG [Burkholderiales bacterium]MCA3163052.1 preprotein translocase subunit SecG [Burkholderiales bacterium]
MEWLQTLLLVLQLAASIGVIVLVLLQHGKGADMGAAFGSGSSGSLFGASGSANFLSRTTAVLITVFFVCTIGLAFFAKKAGTTNTGAGVISTIPGSGAPAANAPAAPAPAAPANEIPK